MEYLVRVSDGYCVLKIRNGQLSAASEKGGWRVSQADAVGVRDVLGHARRLDTEAVRGMGFDPETAITVEQALILVRGETDERATRNTTSLETAITYHQGKWSPSATAAARSLAADPSMADLSPGEWAAGLDQLDKLLGRLRLGNTT